MCAGDWGKEFSGEGGGEEADLGGDVRWGACGLLWEHRGGAERGYADGG